MRRRWNELIGFVFGNKHGINLKYGKTFYKDYISAERMARCKEEKRSEGKRKAVNRERREEMSGKRRREKKKERERDKKRQTRSR